MKVSTVLRKLAQMYADSDDGRMYGSPRTLGASQYICDILGAPGVVCDYESQEEALSYLQRLGMGSGYGQFCLAGEENFGGDPRPRAARRYAWLLFAADLYDEGVR